MGLRKFKDQLQRTIEFHFPPKRIISLVPSQTELLFSLGLDEEIVGITKFCIHPADQFKRKAKVGGTKVLKLDAIRSLKPDLIIGNKEENERGQIEQLMQEFPVWMSDVNDVGDAMQMIKEVGAVTGKETAANSLVEDIQLEFATLRQLRSPKLKAVYLIWKDPYMVAGAYTFIDDVISRAGWENAISAARYPVITKEELCKIGPDLVLLSSEPYPFADKHIEEFRAICPGSHIRIVDGEMFSWYGSRLLHTPEYLYSLKQQFDTVKS